MNRDTNLKRLKSESFDLCIIGAGASGAGVALDATSRGLKVALIDKQDFSSQTSSKSTKLIHGGVRYLEQAVKKLDIEQYRMVSKALWERTTLIKIAPHLTRPMALITPCSNIFEAVYYTIGMKIYDFMAGKHTILPSRLWAKKKVQKLMPELDTSKMSHAVMYYDGQLDDARFGLALVQSAHKNGAAVANHVGITGFKKNTEGKLSTAILKDELTGESFELNAKVFVNCTGPFADHVRQMANPNLHNRIRVSKGAHIVIPKRFLKGDKAILVPKTDDGRVVFLIPWQNQVLVGTTDTEDVLDQDSQADENDIQYLIDYANRYLNETISLTDVLATFSGQRPLLQADQNADTKSLVRDHEVEIDKGSNLVSLMGGKWTTYRLMAKDTVDSIFENILGMTVPNCETDKLLLYGASDFNASLPNDLSKNYAIDLDICENLCHKYGTFSKEILQLTVNDKELKNRLKPHLPHIFAEIDFVIKHEMAITGDDIKRRLGTSFIDHSACQVIDEALDFKNK